MYHAYVKHMWKICMQNMCFIKCIFHMCKTCLTYVQHILNTCWIWHMFYIGIIHMLKLYALLMYWACVNTCWHFSCDIRDFNLWVESQSYQKKRIATVEKKCSVMYIYIRDIKSCMRETTYRAKNIKVIISYSSITPFENNEGVIPQSLF